MGDSDTAHTRRISCGIRSKRTTRAYNWVLGIGYAVLLKVLPQHAVRRAVRDKGTRPKVKRKVNPRVAKPKDPASDLAEAMLLIWAGMMAAKKKKAVVYMLPPEYGAPNPSDIYSGRFQSGHEYSGSFDNFSHAVVPEGKVEKKDQDLGYLVSSENTWQKAAEKEMNESYKALNH